MITTQMPHLRCNRQQTCRAADCRSDGPACAAGCMHPVGRACQTPHAAPCRKSAPRYSEPEPPRLHRQSSCRQRQSRGKCPRARLQSEGEKQRRVDEPILLCWEEVTRLNFRLGTMLHVTLSHSSLPDPPLALPSAIPIHSR